MSMDSQINLTAIGFEMDEMSRFKITTDLQFEQRRFPNHSPIVLLISKLNAETWTFDLSMRYTRGHVAVHKTSASLNEVIEHGIKEFKNNLKVHEFQAAIETFHFDRGVEYDYYTEISTESSYAAKRNLSTLVVEDDPAAAVVLQATLRALGCSVDHFDLPDQALNAFLEKRYDLLVLDWNLPYMKGSEFLVAADLLLKKNDLDGKPVRQVPVVICTSMPLEEINLPPVAHFFFYNHWHKSLPFSSIFGSVDDTTKKIALRNQIAA